MIISGTINIILEKSKSYLKSKYNSDVIKRVIDEEEYDPEFFSTKVEDLVQFIENELRADVFLKNHNFENFKESFIYALENTINQQRLIKDEIRTIRKWISETFWGIDNSQIIIDHVYSMVVLSWDKFRTVTSTNFSKYPHDEIQLDLLVRLVFSYDLIKYLAYLESGPQLIASTTDINKIGNPIKKDALDQKENEQAELKKYIEEKLFYFQGIRKEKSLMTPEDFRHVLDSIVNLISEKKLPDGQVAASLHKRALGFTYDEVMISGKMN